MGANKDGIVHLVKEFGALRMTIALSTFRLLPSHCHETVIHE
jgi:hypothetical protein